MIKKLITALLVIVVAITVWYFILFNQNTVREVTVNLENITAATLLDKSGDKVVEKQAVASGDIIKLPSMTEGFVIKYQAESGYSSGEIAIPLDVNTVDISPEYSTDRLAEMYKSSRSAIRKEYLKAYPDIETLYTIENDQLFRYGDWFAAKLSYKGKSYFNRDSVILVLSKDGDTWKVRSSPPLPIVTSYQIPGVPKSLVETMNKTILE